MPVLRVHPKVWASGPVLENRHYLDTEYAAIVEC